MVLRELGAMYDLVWYICAVWHGRQQHAWTHSNERVSLCVCVRVCVCVYHLLSGVLSLYMHVCVRACVCVRPACSTWSRLSKGIIGSMYVDEYMISFQIRSLHGKWLHYIII